MNSGREWTFLRPGMFAANARSWWAPLELGASLAPNSKLHHYTKVVLAFFSASAMLRTDSPRPYIAVLCQAFGQNR